MLSKTGFTHSDLLCWQIDYAGGSLNVNGTIMRDTYSSSNGVELTGLKLDEEKKQVMKIMQKVWEDDSWLH
ncbi:DinI family protein [Salmonella enterica subsp. enterica]|nr:DinI family protein [Salmonella enterica subsp. enterica serovar Lexington]EDV1075870.1 DinI family protein [Salmonella enterica subsp. enterica]EFO5856140.1 DinI family protein [Salmonella enterica]EDV4642549.1 DinI family protein [Salmonella enterica subsp. enterica serovar Lexington]EDW1526097.1 DinI family protein [Salmonella enterica subsp. enterica serovar Lexington]